MTEENTQKIEEKTENIEETKLENGGTEKKVHDATKKKVEVKPKIKKTSAVVNAYGLQISTKYAKAICKFIKYKRIENAISDLQKVIAKKIPVPMVGEIPHRKGNIMSGRFPKNASEAFIDLLNSLSANANVNGLDNPIIYEAIPNIASRPYGRFGSVRKKRTHVKISAKEMTHSKVKKSGGKK